jgi:hypothetical protein
LRQASIPIKEEWPLNELFLHENKRTTILSDNNNNNNGNTSINFHGDDENADILAKLNHYSSQPQFTNHTSSSSNNFNSSGTINNSSGLLRNELVSATGSSCRTFVPANGFSKEMNTD